METIEISSIQKEGPYLASKFQKLNFLVSNKEYKNLFEDLEFSIHPLGGVIETDVLEISKHEFLEKTYGLGEKIPSFILTQDLSALFVVKIDSEKKMLKVRKPVVFLKPLYFTVSEGKTCETLGKDAVYWGWSLSYPQIYQDVKTNRFEKVHDRFKNTNLWKAFRKKLRDISKVISFEKEGEKITSTFRLGKTCDTNLPQLERAGIKIWEPK